MPKLQNKFAEYEHRWWPKPMDTAQRAELPAYAAAIESTCHCEERSDEAIPIECARTV